MQQRLVALDTGAGLSFVSKSGLLQETHKYIRQPPIIRILDAGGRQLPIAATITLTVRLGAYALKTRFIV